MNKEEWMSIWEKIYERNAERINSAASLTDTDLKLVIDSISVLIPKISQTEAAKIQGRVIDFSTRKKVSKK